MRSRSASVPVWNKNEEQKQPFSLLAFLPVLYLAHRAALVTFLDARSRMN
uniref:Uncharacterized protein n=1 Tax=Anguilla anguilla TaxID=7936 RepID=A0A0E9RN28_ANGAN